MPTSREITITMISGARPEPRIQLTCTLSVFRTANSVATTASTTIAPVRVLSRFERELALSFSPGPYGHALSVPRALGVAP